MAESGVGVVKAASKRFDYLGESVLRYGQAWRWWTQSQRVERSASALAQLAAEHDAICGREEGIELRRWLAESKGTRPGQGRASQGEAIDEAEFERGLRGLLRLLHALGQQGLQPFDAPPLRLDHPGVGAENLRREREVSLRRLAQAARDLGIRPGHRSLSRFVDRITPVQFNRLARIAHALSHRIRQGPQKWQLDQASLAVAEPDLLATLAALMHTLDALDIF